jgi:hypothetical protein
VTHRRRVPTNAGSYERPYRLDLSGPVPHLGEVLDRLRRAVEELAAFCEGDISYTPLKGLDVDLAAPLVTYGDFAPEVIELCHEPGPDDTFVFSLERREHGPGVDLADVLEMLEEFASEIEWLVEEGADLRPGHPVEIALKLTMTTHTPRLAARHGFLPA